MQKKKMLIKVYRFNTVPPLTLARTVIVLIGKIIIIIVIIMVIIIWL